MQFYWLSSVKNEVAFSLQIEYTCHDVMTLYKINCILYEGMHLMVFSFMGIPLM